MLQAPHADVLQAARMLQFVRCKGRSLANRAPAPAPRLSGQSQPALEANASARSRPRLGSGSASRSHPAASSASCSSARKPVGIGDDGHRHGDQVRRGLGRYRGGQQVSAKAENARHRQIPLSNRKILTSEDCNSNTGETGAPAAPALSDQG